MSQWHSKPPFAHPCPYSYTCIHMSLSTFVWLDSLYLSVYAHIGKHSILCSTRQTSFPTRVVSTTPAPGYGGYLRETSHFRPWNRIQSPGTTKGPYNKKKTTCIFPYWYSFHLHLRMRTVAITKLTVTSTLKLSWSPPPRPWPLDTRDCIFTIITSLVRSANCNYVPSSAELINFTEDQLWSPLKALPNVQPEPAASVSHRYHSVRLGISITLSWQLPDPVCHHEVIVGCVLIKG